MFFLQVFFYICLWIVEVFHGLTLAVMPKKIMTKKLFYNKKTIRREDLFRQLVIGFFVCLFMFYLILLRDHFRNKPSNTSLALIFVIAFFLIFTYKAVFEKTIKQIDFDEEKSKLIITIEKQLLKKEVLEFKNYDIELEEKTIRYITVKHRFLKISDGIKSLKISTKDKGIGNKNFDQIIALIQTHYH